MSDCISRQDAIHAFDNCLGMNRVQAQDILMGLPSVTPTEPKGPTLNPNFVPFWDKEEKTVPQMLQEFVDVMCQNYCKYPEQWDEEAEGVELSESDICANCPLNRLV